MNSMMNSICHIIITESEGSNQEHQQTMDLFADASVATDYFKKCRERGMEEVKNRGDYSVHIDTESHFLVVSDSSELWIEVKHFIKPVN